MSNRRESILRYLQIDKGRVLEEHVGGNSLVLKCEGKDSKILGVKIYMGDSQRQEQMISREYKSINYLNSLGFPNIPKNFIPILELNVVTFDWFEGEKSPCDTDSLNQLLKMTLDLYEATKSKNLFPIAVDAVFEIADLKSQLRYRLDRLMDLGAPTFIPNFAENMMKRIEIALGGVPAQLKFDEISLSLSDMGAHNLIRGADMSYQFIDFEFFGIDSITKLMADFWLHPQNLFPDSDIRSFQQSLVSATGWNPTSFSVALPLFTLKWSLIAYGRELRDARSGNLPLRDALTSRSKGEGYLKYFDSIIDQASAPEFSTFNNFLSEDGTQVGHQ